MIIWIFFWLFPFSSSRCIPGCTNDEVCINSACYKANIGYSTCNSNSECADSLNGQCNGTCVCNSKRLFSWYFLKCLIPTQKSTEYCATKADCTDQSSFYAGCINNLCVCTKGSGVNSINGKCGIRNENQYGNTCGSDVDRCEDDLYGECRNNFCECQPNYKFLLKEGICRSYNTGINQCNAIVDCWDRSDKAICNGTCQCVDFFSFSTSRLACIAYNDNTQTCSNLNQCFDNSARALCDGKCTCNGVFNFTTHLCEAHNYGTLPCNSIKNCADQTLGLALCKTNLCTCVSGAEYNSTLKKCLAPNSGSYSSPDITHCMDYSILRSFYDGTCNCKSNYLWDPSSKLCLGINDGTSECDYDVQNCYDHSNLGECSFFCTCKRGSEWSSISLACICIESYIYSNLDDTCQCAPGFFINSTSLNGCDPCPAGTYQNLTGQTSCLNCAPNYYNPSVGQIDCEICPLNSGSTGKASFCTCNSGYYYDTSDEYCKKCSQSCLECNGNSTNCTVCNSTILGLIKVSLSTSYSECLCNNSSYKVSDGSGEIASCLPCSELCGTCYGGTREECISCNSTIKHLILAEESKCECEDGFFWDENQANLIESCQPCNDFCAKCERNKDNCSECLSNSGLILENNNCSCSQPGYSVVINSTTTKQECIKCHPLCFECFGTEPTQCLSCNSIIGAKYSDPQTCVCDNLYYYSVNSEKCEACNSLCENCFGGTSSECYNCSAYSVEGSPYLCVSECTELGAYYFSDGMCKKCHQDCASCWNEKNSSCFSCSNSSLYLYNGNCQESCPNHYYTEDLICFECHSSCGHCDGPSIFQCNSCRSGNFLNKNKCLVECPNGTFPSGEICLACPTICQTCVTGTSCTLCKKGYYLIVESEKCVPPINCPEGTYPNIQTSTCEKCDVSCNTCVGKKKEDCIICNSKLGYLKLFVGIGACNLLTCVEGQYLAIDNNISSCKSCDISCLICDGAGNNNCLYCNEGYVSVDYSISNKITCQVCKEINNGYTTSSDGQCREICGDGENYGQYECDDGNTIEGDGCSSVCTIESGFSCSHKNKKDTCKNIVPPSAILSLDLNNNLIVTFSEEIVFTVNSEKLNMFVFLYTESGLCSFSWTIQNSFPTNYHISFFTINTEIKCSLSGKREFFSVIFNEPSQIIDAEGNILSTPVLEVSAKKFSYIPEGEKEIVESIGTTFSCISIIFLIISLGMTLFKSNGINTFWSFLNLTQMLSLLPILYTPIPLNFLIFVTKYLSIIGISIPFSYLPDWFPKFSYIFSNFSTLPLNERYELCGYHSVSFLYNFSDELLTWLFLLVCYGILNILTIFISRRKCKFLFKLKEDYQYDCVIRVLLECYLKLNFSSWLSLKYLPLDSNFSVISYFSAIFALYFSAIFFLKCSNLVEVHERELNCEYFKKHYGVLIDEINITSSCGRKFYPLFMARRFLYVCILVLLNENQVIQLVLIIFLAIIPMFEYFFLIMPFLKKSHNVMNEINECILFICFLFTFFINIFCLNDFIMSVMGWIMIGGVFSSLICSFILMIPQVIKEIKLLCSQKERRQIVVTIINSRSDIKTETGSAQSPFHML